MKINYHKISDAELWINILNNNNDGVIFTSLYGHNSCNTYVREVRGGQTAVKLLDEERRSLEYARTNRKGD